MFSIFKKNRPVKGQVEVSGYKSARDMNTTAIHIEKSKGAPLCGTERALYGDSEVLVETVISTVNNQHAGWHWCAECASKFTGKSESFFTDARKK